MITTTASKTPSVSVIIPTYNYGEFLPEAIESARDQTQPDLEIIVVDDGSNDDTPRVLNKLEGSDLRWRRTSNRGVSAARNLGLRMSEGEYVAFLDADDVWSPEKVERQVELLRAEPEVGFVFCDFVRFDSGGQFPDSQFDLIPEMKDLPVRQGSHGDGFVLEGDTLTELVALRLTPVYPSTLVVRGSLARGIEFPEDIGASQDLYYFLALYQAAKGGFLTDPLVGIRRHGDNLSDATVEKRMTDIQVIRKFVARAALDEYKNFLARELARRLAGLGHEHFWSGRYLESARAYLRCLGHPGRRLNALLHLATLPVAPMIRSWVDPS